ncbi:sigma-70 family RNA polymerase sigma factor [Salegentibacter sp. BDJ18]|uniref:RNA polymerase sigma factor n=1 Tax=Salegentibacter sp. BDJ18 TaxID=2816376 RepID=UPI001AAF92E0|nr:sigma-70 family RNA polymerase sigma factor [Salegentibacter sp. BDJ18]MBO2543580.1 sigma-70 family RNA polymerase sigma factor [Salegentibacter sp. BDJ18]
MEKGDTYFLVRALKSGDINSLEKVYKIYYSKLYWFSKKFDSATMESDDFVQQTFLKIWENRDQLKDNVSLDQQIFIICKNLILNHLKREAKTVAQIEEIYLPKNEETEGVEFKNTNIKKLRLIIEKLPPKRKNIFLLHKIDNLTYEEISVSLGISKKTIANHIYLAHNYIKEELCES